LSTTLDLSLVVNRTLIDDGGGVGDAESPGDDGTAADGRRHDAGGDPANVVLVGAACGSGLVMFTAVLTAVVFALRSHYRRRHGRSSAGYCCCCCCYDDDKRGPSLIIQVI